MPIPQFDLFSFEGNVFKGNGWFVIARMWRYMPTIKKNWVLFGIQINWDEINISLFGYNWKIKLPEEKRSESNAKAN